MRITSPVSTYGPPEGFTGQVILDLIAEASASSPTSALVTHFSPGARTAWHTHPLGQTLYVIEGIGRCQRQGGAIMEILPGDRVYFDAGELHWHGAAPQRPMSHIAIQEADNSGPVAWHAQVTDAEYFGPVEQARAEADAINRSMIEIASPTTSRG